MIAGGHGGNAQFSGFPGRVIGEGFVKNSGPSRWALVAFDFPFHPATSLEQKLADVSHGGSFAVRDAVLRDAEEEFPEEMIDVGGGLEFAGKGNELLAELFDGEELSHFAGLASRLAGVEEAERSMTFPPNHAALAAVDGRELAAIGVGFGGGHRAGGSSGICRCARGRELHKSLQAA